jgi:hypothetical protein
VAVVLFVLLKYLGTINAWKLTHWLFSYELGFVKRGLVGTLAHAVLPRGIVTREAVVVASLVVVAVFLIALACFALPLFGGEERRRSWYVGLVALLAPGIGYLLSDLGRFDILNVALCLLTLLAARRLGRFPYPLFVAVSWLILLIHEAALLIALPMLFVAYLHANGRLGELAELRRWPLLALRLAPALLLAAVIALLGRSDLALPDLVARLATQADFAPSPESAFVLERSLDSDVAQVMGETTDDSNGAEMKELRLGGVDPLPFELILGVAALQQLFAHLVFLALDRARRRPTLIALHLGFAAPLLLMLVGVDWQRWAAMASAQSTVMMLLFARDLPATRESPLPIGLAALALGLVVVTAGSSYEMEGARREIVESPQTSVLFLIEDAHRSRFWYQAFLKMRPEPGLRRIARGHPG